MKRPQLCLVLLLLLFSCESNDSTTEVNSSDNPIVEENGPEVDTPEGDSDEEIPENTVSQIGLLNAFPNLGFSKPVDLQSPADGSNRIFVVEQNGRIKVFPNQTTTATSENFLDITNSVVSSGELGLLGLAFHPNYGENGFLYVYYTPSNSLAVISRFQVSGSNPNSADLGSEKVLLRIPQPFTNHNGGQLAFGPDGYLYVSSGDGGSGGDPQGNAQNLNSLLGKILRIDVNAGGNYGIPADNPFANAVNAREEIYAYGLRNPWRMSFDIQTGSLWAGDVGQNRLEEIDVIISGGNYGWKIFEGTECFSGDCDSAALIPPVFEYNHEGGDKSITGGHVYRGPSITTISGDYIYGDFISGKIWALNTENIQESDNRLLVESGVNISAFGTDADNELYVCGFDGNIYRFVEI